MVTDDPQAASVSDRLVLLRDGRVVADRATPAVATIAAELRAVA
jgi:ABC-type hemin transport system ATPase subunit